MRLRREQAVSGRGLEALPAVALHVRARVMVDFAVWAAVLAGLEVGGPTSARSVSVGSLPAVPRLSRLACLDGEVARRLDGGKLVIATVASHEPEGYFEAYRKAFADLGVTDVIELYVRERAETLDPQKLWSFEDATGVFFSVGDQLRISS